MSVDPSSNSDELSAEQVRSVRNHLDEVIGSSAFAGSKRSQDFLQLVVEHALAGRYDSLRERMIGAEMLPQTTRWSESKPPKFEESSRSSTSKRQIRRQSASSFRQAPMCRSSTGNHYLSRKPKLVLHLPSNHFRRRSSTNKTNKKRYLISPEEHPAVLCTCGQVSWLDWACLRPSAIWASKG